MQESNAHINSPSHPNKKDGTDKKKEGNHQKKIHKLTKAQQENDNPCRVKQSKRPKKDEPAHKHSKSMTATACTTQEQ